MCFYLGKLLLKPVYFDLRWFYTPTLTKITPFTVTKTHHSLKSLEDTGILFYRKLQVFAQKWYFIDLKSILKAITENN